MYMLTTNCIDVLWQEVDFVNNPLNYGLCMVMDSEHGWWWLGGHIYSLNLPQTDKAFDFCNFYNKEVQI